MNHNSENIKNVLRASSIFQNILEKKVGNVGQFEAYKIREAWITNLKRDISEVQAGFLANSMCDIDAQLRTALEAIHAYAVHPDESILYESIAMIQLAEWMLREGPKARSTMKKLESALHYAAQADSA